MYVLLDTESVIPSYFKEFIWDEGRKFANTKTAPAGLKAIALFSYVLNKGVERFPTKREAEKAAQIVKRVARLPKAPVPVLEESCTS